jgi:hypothetical protein
MREDFVGAFRNSNHLAKTNEFLLVIVWKAQTFHPTRTGLFFPRFRSDKTNFPRSDSVGPFDEILMDESGFI